MMPGSVGQCSSLQIACTDKEPRHTCTPLLTGPAHLEESLLFVLSSRHVDFSHVHLVWSAQLVQVPAGGKSAATEVRGCPKGEGNTARSSALSLHVHRAPPTHSSGNYRCLRAYHSTILPRLAGCVHNVRRELPAAAQQCTV